MNITIAESLRPFSHAPSVRCIVPFSAWQISVFPSRLCCEHLVDGQSCEFSLGIQGPIKEFTVQQDLELGFVKVFGFALDGYFRYVLNIHEGYLQLCFEKLPEQGIKLSSENLSKSYTSGETIVIGTKKELCLQTSMEKLSLGQHKAQDWCAMRKRKDLSEIFPHWMRLGQIVPQLPYQASNEGMLHLLNQCKIAAQSDKMQVKEAFIKLFLAGFSSMLAPRLVDDEYQGIAPSSSIPSGASPLFLLSMGSSVIRSLFFQEEQGIYHLLPCLPPDFHSGRLIRLKTSQDDTIDLEWSKKMLRRAVIHVGSAKDLVLALQKPIESYRLRHSMKSRGVVVKPAEKISCQAGDVLYLDRFQK